MITGIGDSTKENEIYQPTIYKGDCGEIIKEKIEKNSIDLTFLDPPFNQRKRYEKHDDDMNADEYWEWMARICKLIHKKTKVGGSIYFMQREKNTEQVLKVLRESGWTLQNLIIWKKMTSAVPQKYRFSKQYQIIAFAVKGKAPKHFNRIRYDAPLAPHMKISRKNGIYLTDVWDDIRELTSGFFAGDEALRDPVCKKRLHEQQAPVALLLRIILSSSCPGDLILDPFAGTGTTNVVAMQLKRRSIGIENSANNVKIIKDRIKTLRKADDVIKWRDYYRFTANLDEIWPATTSENAKITMIKETPQIKKLTDFIVHQ
ncbi:MAG: DNA-methyltransferase [Promethearchaeota archaeon]